MMPRILPLLRKEFLHIIRDPRSLYLALGLPMILVILFGYAITMDVSHIPVAIIDLDSTQLSRDFQFRLGSSGTFDILIRDRPYGEADKMLDEGRVKIIIVIPPGFEKDLKKGKNSFLQILVDGSDNNTAQVALGYLSAVVQNFSLTMLVPNKIPPVNMEPRVWFNPELRSVNFIIPGLIAVIMMVLSVMLTSLAIAREWEVGTMEQLIATPAKPAEIIIGKLLPYFFIGLLQTTLVVGAAILIFDVPLKGNLFLLILASSIFLICGLGIGLLISVVTKSQQLAFMFSIISSLLPAFLLSGFIFPISSMPPVIQYISTLVPAKYFLNVLRGIFLKGNGLAVLWPDILIMLLFALGILAVSTKRLKLNLE